MASRTRPDLPGFTYDERSGRYIRILENHHARALGGIASAASTSAVGVSKAKARYELQTGSGLKRLVFKKSIPIRRSKIHQHAVVGISMALQSYGSSNHNLADLRAEAWSDMLSLTSKTTRNPRPARAAYLLQPNTEYLPMLGVFAVSPISSQGSDLGWCLEDGSNTLGYTMLNASFTRATSLHSRDENVYICTFSREAPNLLFTMVANEQGSSNQCVLREVRQVKKPSSIHDYWCADLHPNKYTNVMAVGTETSVMVSCPSWSRERVLEYKQNGTASPVLSIKWKSEQICAAGRRDGSIFLYDTRAPSHIFRLRHGTSAMRLHCIDESRILVGGPEKLAIYDLRYNKEPHRTRSSRPWLKYSQYNNRRIRNHDTDVSPRLGIIAVAQEYNTEIWNLWTGRRLQTLKTSGLVNADAISFLREMHPAQFFVEESDPTGLLVSMEGQILKFSVDGRGTFNRTPVNSQFDDLM